MKDCVGMGQKLVWFHPTFQLLLQIPFADDTQMKKKDSKTLFNAYSFEDCVRMTTKF